MVAPEAIGPLQRYAALVAEQPIIRLPEPISRELGLREGQFVQASLEMQPEGLTLRLGDRLLMLPPGWQRFAAGDMRWFQVVRQPGGGIALKSSAAPPGPLPAALSGGSTASAASNPSNLPSATAIAPSGAEATAAPALRLNSLLSRPPSFESLFNILRPGVLEALGQAQPDAVRLAASMAALRLRVDHLSAQSVQQAMIMSGLWSESILASGRALPGQDLKSLLRQTLRLLGPGSAAARDVESAIDEIERSQVDAVQAQNDQRQVFSMMLPFADAEPAWVRFEREPRRPGQNGQRYVIDLHLRPPALGDLWIKTGVMARDVDLTVWTRRPEIARLVEQFRDELEIELTEAGLHLQAMRIIDTARPDPPADSSVPTRPQLDLRA